MSLKRGVYAWRCAGCSNAWAQHPGDLGGTDTAADTIDRREEHIATRGDDED